MLTVYLDDTMKNKQVIRMSEACTNKLNSVELNRLCNDIAHDVSHGLYHSITFVK
jgi:hypothetical protein